MRIALFIFALAAIPASAAELAKAQCDALITKAFLQDREVSIQLLNSRAVRECFRQFPDLTEKYFPVKTNQPGPSRDPAFSVQTNQLGPSRDPAFSVRTE